jgi:hypothetical protein
MKNPKVVLFGLAFLITGMVVYLLIDFGIINLGNNSKNNNPPVTNNTTISSDENG